ncbi:BTAD domain-containing putative transcriptional regulator [Streptomyces sp. NPDC058045]|uniref:AfsR/SARP family transcriptional regulator n=1 Tax=Streptomyces sp. NPDC058045 TaxID=3346311 RepID=UPI0036DFE179
MGGMDFRVLGHVSARSGGGTVALDGDKQRTVLAALLLARGTVVTDERLSTLLWSWDPPAGSTKQLYTYVSRLRTRIGGAVSLERTGRGYRLDIGDAFFDWAAFHDFTRTGAAALRAGRHPEAERRFAAALALWNGPVPTGVTERFAEAEGQRLVEARLAALEDYVEAALATGGHAEAVPALTREVAEHPLRERLRGQLMTALHRSGRQADALAVYESGRRILADDLGIDPGTGLRTLHREILTGTLFCPGARTTAAEPVGTGVLPPADGGPGPVAGAVVRKATVPAQVPPAPADFTGRHREAGEVVGALRAQRDVVITGAPGTGKSALARHVAERCRDAFPDGLLHADLGAAGPARTPQEVLGWFLCALGTAPAELPHTLDERVQLYRTSSAGRRLLVVLDGAVDDAQVRPLLPGAGESRTLVTGVRASLGSLEGTRLVRLGPLAAPDAVGLLAAVAGPERIAAEPDAAARIAELCDRTPLALRIAAARLAARPHWSAARLAARLEPEERRLGELKFGSLDAAAGPRAVLHALSGELRRAFTAIAAVGPRRLTATGAALLLGTGAEDAEEILDQLADVWLLEGHTPAGGHWPHYRVVPLARLAAAVRPPALTAVSE